MFQTAAQRGAQFLRQVECPRNLFHTWLGAAVFQKIDDLFVGGQRPHIRFRAGAARHVVAFFAACVADFLAPVLAAALARVFLEAAFLLLKIWLR